MTDFTLIMNVGLRGATTSRGATTVRKLGGLVHGERGGRAYNGGLRAVPPMGSRGRSPSEADEFSAHETHILQ